MRFKTLLWASIMVVGLSSCGLLNSFLPDQEFADGLLGIGEGLEVALSVSAGASGSSIARTQSGGTVFSGVFGGVDVIEADASIPSWVRAKSVTESVYLQRTLDANFNVDQFTVSSIGFEGTFSIDGQEFPIPFSSPVTGLALVFERRSCAGTCTFEATGDLPVFRINLTKSQVSAYNDVIKNGGEVEVDVTVTMTVTDVGLSGGSVTWVFIMTNGAVVSFR